ncbi:hypothetical protein H0V99_00410 [Candidatus Saccharibacteria bacterium]|nr:hypothetical protein [Candidatus Saccharibacteria bacterium]
MAKQLNVLSGKQREAMVRLRDSVSDARTSITKYASSDDSEQQAQALQAGIEHITDANDAILNASQYDLLDAADVAHLSALAQHIKERLE